jgi:hypothetical protein
MCILVTKSEATITIIRATVTWLSTTITATSKYITCIEHIFALWLKYQQTRGLRWTIGHFKDLRLCVTRYLCDQPIHVMSGVGLRKDGLPKALGPLNDLFQSKDTTSLRFGLTLMCIGKPITLPVKPKLEDIADKWTGTLHDGVMEYIPTFVEKLRKPYMEWESPHWSTKSGPNGHALGMALKEFLALPYFMTQALLALGGEDFRDYINKLRKALKGTEAEKNVKFRRLHFLQDKEGKTRTIAILDYWSQTVLKPYHDGVMKILRKLPGDFTYQGDFRSWLEQGTGTYYSMDLTAATDRFPLEFQKKLLEVMWGPKKAMA